MKDNYDKNIKLLCATCGSSDFFEKNEITGGITCKKCNRIYHGGYDEILSLNQHIIGAEIDFLTEEIQQDLEKDLKNILGKAGFKIK